MMMGTRLQAGVLWCHMGQLFREAPAALTPVHGRCGVSFTYLWLCNKLMEKHAGKSPMVKLLPNLA